MKRLDLDRTITFFTIGLIVFSIGLAVGFLWAVDTAYDTGYKMAYLEMKQLLKEGHESNRDFHISGLPFRFRPQSDKKAIQVIMGR